MSEASSWIARRSKLTKVSLFERIKCKKKLLCNVDEGISLYMFAHYCSVCGAKYYADLHSVSEGNVLLFAVSSWKVMAMKTRSRLKQEAPLNCKRKIV